MKDFEQQLLKVAEWQCKRQAGKVGARTPTANECPCVDGLRKCPLKWFYPQDKRVYRLTKDGVCSIQSKWIK